MRFPRIPLPTLVHATLTRLPSAADDAVTTIQSDRKSIDRQWKALEASGLGKEQGKLVTLTVAHRKEADKAVDAVIELLKAEQYDLAQLQLSNDVQSAVVPLKSDFSNLFGLAVDGGNAVAEAQHADIARGEVYSSVLLGIALLLASVIDIAIIRSRTWTTTLPSCVSMSASEAPASAPPRCSISWIR